MTCVNTEDDLRWALRIQEELRRIRTESGAGCYRVSSYMGVSRQSISGAHSPKRANVTVLRLTELCSAVWRACDAVGYPTPAIVVTLVDPDAAIADDYMDTLNRSMMDPVGHMGVLRAQFAQAADMAGMGKFEISLASGVPSGSINAMMEPDLWDPTIFAWRRAARAIGMDFEVLFSGVPLA